MERKIDVVDMPELKATTEFHRYIELILRLCAESLMMHGFWSVDLTSLEDNLRVALLYQWNGNEPSMSFLRRFRSKDPFRVGYDVFEAIPTNNSSIRSQTEKMYRRMFSDALYLRFIEGNLLEYVIDDLMVMTNDFKFEAGTSANLVKADKDRLNPSDDYFRVSNDCKFMLSNCYNIQNLLIDKVNRKCCRIVHQNIRVPKLHQEALEQLMRL